MRTYRNALAVLALAVVLALSTRASAGIMHTGVVSPTPTPTPDGVTQTSAEGGVTQAEEAEATPDASSLMTEAALDLVRNLLTLF